MSINSRTFDLDTRPGHLSYVLRARLHTTVRQSGAVHLAAGGSRAHPCWRRPGALRHLRAHRRRHEEGPLAELGADRQLYYRETDTWPPGERGDVRMAQAGRRGRRPRAGARCHRRTVRPGRRQPRGRRPAREHRRRRSPAEVATRWRARVRRSPRRGRRPATCISSASRARAWSSMAWSAPGRAALADAPGPRLRQLRHRGRGARRDRGVRGQRAGRGLPPARRRRRRVDVPRGRSRASSRWPPRPGEDGRQARPLAFTAERRVFSKVWDGRAWDTPPGKWTTLGLLDEIDQPAPAVSRKVGSRQGAGRSDAARRTE